LNSVVPYVLSSVEMLLLSAGWVRFSWREALSMLPVSSTARK
jgi:hypothetical protein